KVGRVARVRCFPDAAQRPGAIRIKQNSKVVVVLLQNRILVDLPEDNGSVYARLRSVKMSAGDIGVGRRRLTRSRAEIEALDVERVARGYRLAVEDDRPDAACRRVSRGYFLVTFDDHAEHSGHEISSLSV